MYTITWFFQSQHKSDINLKLNNIYQVTILLTTADGNGLIAIMKISRLKKHIHKTRGITITAAAIEINCSRQRLTDLVNQRASCGRVLAFRIEKWSKLDGIANELMRQ